MSKTGRWILSTNSQKKLSQHLENHFLDRLPRVLRILGFKERNELCALDVLELGRFLVVHDCEVLLVVMQVIQRERSKTRKKTFFT